MKSAWRTIEIEEGAHVGRTVGVLSDQPIREILRRRAARVSSAVSRGGRDHAYRGEKLGYQALRRKKRCAGACREKSLSKKGDKKKTDASSPPKTGGRLRQRRINNRRRKSLIYRIYHIRHRDQSRLENDHQDGVYS